MRGVEVLRGRVWFENVFVVLAFTRMLRVYVCFLVLRCVGYMTKSISRGEFEKKWFAGAESKARYHSRYVCFVDDESQTDLLAAAEAEDEVQRGLLLDVVVGERAAVLEVAVTGCI
jgi:hypothetical protein